MKTRKAVRQEAEREQAKEGEDVFYPTWEALKAEDREEKPAMILVIRDEEGSVVLHRQALVDHNIFVLINVVN